MGGVLFTRDAAQFHEGELVDRRCVEPECGQNYHMRFWLTIEAEGLDFA